MAFLFFFRQECRVTAISFAQEFPVSTRVPEVAVKILGQWSMVKTWQEPFALSKVKSET